MIYTINWHFKTPNKHEEILLKMFDKGCTYNLSIFEHIFYAFGLKAILKGDKDQIYIEVE